MGLQKRLLRSSQIGPMISRAAGHRSHRKHLQLDPLAVQIGVRFVPVHLGLDAPRVALRNECLAAPEAQLLLAQAIDDWLAAREQWLDGRGRETLDRCTAATNVLYAAFAQDWQGNERAFDESFKQFKETLIEDESFGSCLLEVSEVYPNRAK